MSDIKREDLRVAEDHEWAVMFGGEPFQTFRSATDADLAALGYVRLDVDVEALLRSVVNALEAANTIGMRSCNPGDHLHYAHHDMLIEQARQVLAALDGEEA